jgi:predicted metal-dependent hydrolase
MEVIKLGDIDVEVTLKEIKNVHLSVYPPYGKVKVAAPNRMSLENIKIYTISKLGWIKEQQKKFKLQIRESKREYLSKESHYFLGKRYMLKIMEIDNPPCVVLRHKIIELYVRPKSTQLKNHSVIEEWYRSELKKVSQELIIKWQKKIGVKCDSFTVRKMKTKWGSCNTNSKSILLNLELAKKPYQCIEYIVVHELVHLLERKHNDRFIVLMNRYLPEWKQLKNDLNRLPISHYEWDY